MPRFRLGRILATPGVLGSVPEAEMLDAIARHSVGDWGNVVDDDRQANEDALRDGARLLSVYVTGAGTRFWVMTEADRCSTTVLLPDEY